MPQAQKKEPLRAKPKELGGHSFMVGYFTPSDAIPMLGRIIEIAGPIVTAWNKDLAETLRNAGLSSPSTLELVKDLLGSTMWRSNGKWISVKESFNDPNLFVGPEGLDTLFRLVAFVVEVNFNVPFLFSKLGVNLPQAEPEVEGSGSRMSEGSSEMQVAS